MEENKENNQKAKEKIPIPIDTLDEEKVSTTQKTYDKATYAAMWIRMLEKAFDLFEAGEFKRFIRQVQNIRTSLLVVDRPKLDAKMKEYVAEEGLSTNQLKVDFHLAMLTESKDLLEATGQIVKVREVTTGGG